MIRLNAGFSRKVGEPNYGSRGASVNVELELESNLIGDPDALSARIRELFALAKQSVDTELSNGQASANGCSSPAKPQTRTTGRDERPTRYATTSQVRAIHAICNRQNVDAVQRANERFEVNDLEELTLREASTLIDELKGTSNNGRKAGVR